jgi:hypothetical protein
MPNKIKIELAKKAVGRGSSGLYFIDDILRNKKGGTDSAFSRSWYILLSFNFELILKAILILENQKNSKQEILNSIKGHNLVSLSKVINDISLKKYGIDNIKKQTDNNFIFYIVEISDNRGSVIIQDLIDVRYDFEKEQLRNSESNEINRIKNEIKLLLSVVDEINKIVWPTLTAQTPSK